MKAFYAASAALVPLMTVIIGALLAKFPPKKINHLVGYRTPRSRKSQEAWEFAQRYCGRIWVKSGAAMLSATGIVLFFIRSMEEEAFSAAVSVVILLQVLGLLAAIPATEGELKRRF